MPNSTECRYVVAHNTTKSMLDAYVDARGDEFIPPDGSELRILTIGQISYYDSQECFVNHLANRKGVVLSFVGAGPASGPLQQYVQKKGITNVTFGGRYEKKDEISIIDSCHMINIWLKHDINADSCMANRFYLSAQLRKPMIVSMNSHQGDLCEQYGLGVALEENDDFLKKIKKWWNEFDAEKYYSGCQKFLKTVKSDTERFENELVRLYVKS